MRALMSFSVLFATWLVLSGHFTGHLPVLGFACSVTITLFCDRLRLLGRGPLPIRPLRVPAYYAWLGWQVFLANLSVARRVWSPKLDIDPQMIQLPNELKTETATAILANSVTLTPGTVTVAADMDRLLIHSLTQSYGEDVLEGEMARRVRHLETE